MINRQEMHIAFAKLALHSVFNGRLHWTDNNGEITSRTQFVELAWQIADDMMVEFDKRFSKENDFDRAD